MFYNVHLMFRQPQASTESVPGSPGGVPQPQPVSAEVPAGDSAAAAPHHGVHPPAPLHLPQLRHVAQGLPREISDNLARASGRYPLNNAFDEILTRPLHLVFSCDQPIDRFLLINYDFYIAILLSRSCSKLFYNIELR